MRGEATFLSSGSQWRRWEPHVHAPGTIFNDQFVGSDAWEKYLTALETATPQVRALGITDYYSTGSYERVVAAKASGRLAKCDLIFPNIEMRLGIGTVKGNWVNVHLLVSPDDSNHLTELGRFLARLTFRAFDDDFACTPGDLVKLGRLANPALNEDAAAREYGSQQFKVSFEQLAKAYREFGWARENILVAVAGGADGTSGVRDAADVTMRQEIEKFAHVIFASSPSQRDFWLGRKAEGIEIIRSRYGALKPCLHGSDAHTIETVAAPDLSRFSWVKGEIQFDSLKQACIEPLRAFVGEVPPTGAAPSQAISRIAVYGADWALTPNIELNSGLVAIIGARGSGKTALADMIAAGCDALPATANEQSFLTRAQDLLAGATVTVTWGDGGEPATRPLDGSSVFLSEQYPRARYLSQQFVDDLCSSVGMTDALMREIERVVFQAHPSADRDGAVDFDELLDMRASLHRDMRGREEEALANVSERIGTEIDKNKLLPALKTQIAEKKLQLGRHNSDRAKLISKGTEVRAARLDQVTQAAEKVRSYLRYYANQNSSLLSIEAEVADLRKNQAPEALRRLKEDHEASGLANADWDPFLLKYSGDVDAIIQSRKTKASGDAEKWKGRTPSPSVDGAAFVADDANLELTPLGILEAEIARLQKLVTVDRETADRYAAIAKKIVDETNALARLEERLADCEGARARAQDLVKEREAGYERVFDAVLGEQKVLTDLYAPLSGRLLDSKGSLRKLAFSVRRVADVERWAKGGEALFDLRKQSPFRGQGTLLRKALAELKDAWETGDTASVSQSMAAFRDKYQDELLTYSPVSKADQVDYRAWTKRFAQWLYGTDHISINYSVDYDGVDIRKLSPGTRGIVLLLLYLALDDVDDRPLIIDQPEENLDPKSIFEELVGLFKEAKGKRQVIIVTHNANLVINADADQIIVADAGPHPAGGLPPITYVSGGLETASIRKTVCDILEGGELAFKERARRLRVALDR